MTLNQDEQTVAYTLRDLPQHRLQALSDLFLRSPELLRPLIAKEMHSRFPSPPLQHGLLT